MRYRGVSCIFDFYAAGDAGLPGEKRTDMWMCGGLFYISLLDTASVNRKHCIDSPTFY